MSRNLVKAGQAVLKDENARVIDSNDLVEQRLSMLRAIMEAEENGDEMFDGFSEGLDAEQVDGLFADRAEGQEIESEPSVSFEEQLAAVKEEAEMIINSARQEADDILNQASMQAEDIREQAKNDGYNQGYDAGYNEGQIKAEAAMQEAEELKQSLMADYEAKLAELEPQFVDKLTEIYDKVLHTNLSSKREVVLYLLKDAIRGIDGGKNFIVHVSKEEYPVAFANREWLSSGMGQNCSMEIVEDMTLPSGECYVEAEGGIFDCGIGTQMEGLKKELILLSNGAME